MALSPLLTGGMGREEVLRPPEDLSAPERFERYPGGAATSRGGLDANAFSHPSGNLDFEERGDFFVGNGVFKKLWVPAPASTQASDGLGPFFNARSCQGCHLKDGRGHPHDEDGAASFILGLSVPTHKAVAEPPQSVSELVVPEPAYGAQLQDHAATGLVPEGRSEVTYEERPVALAGGEIVQLLVPNYRSEDPAHGPLAPEVMISPRVAQPAIGLGLLEAIAEADILALADPDDADGDGISGRAHLAIDALTGEEMLGRFGWKAIQPTVRQQSAFAFVTDMGLSSAVAPHPEGDCAQAQTTCREAPHGTSNATFEVPDEMLDLVAFYSRNLAVPPRRDEGADEVLRGKELFYEIGCTGCHTPKFVTAEEESIAPHLRRQLIWPYTDMLLHDMGEGLANHRPQGLADGREWRTPPLWGIGLTEEVNGHTLFLRDGRARSVTEAILWHVGEAEASAEAFRTLDKADRDALVAFVNSL